MIRSTALSAELPGGMVLCFPDADVPKGVAGPRHDVGRMNPLEC
jgi:hypothetical protein